MVNAGTADLDTSTLTPFLTSAVTVWLQERMALKSILSQHYNHKESFSEKISHVPTLTKQQPHTYDLHEVITALIYTLYPH